MISQAGFAFEGTFPKLISERAFEAAWWSNALQQYRENFGDNQVNIYMY